MSQFQLTPRSYTVTIPGDAQERARILAIFDADPAAEKHFNVELGNGIVTVVKTACPDLLLMAKLSNDDVTFYPPWP